MGIKYNKNYTVEFVSLFENKPNKVVVSGTGIHKWTPSQLEMFELKMKKIQTEDIQRDQMSAQEPVNHKVFRPIVNDMVLVSSPKWKGARRGILLNMVNNQEHPMVSLYLYDHGTMHTCSQDDVSRIPKEHKEKRPAVYMVTVEQVFPTVVSMQENKIEWNKQAALFVQTWMSQPTRNRKLSMKITFIANHYELIGDFCYFAADERGTVVADSLSLADKMLQHKYACGILQYKKLLGLISNEVTDKSLLPKFRDGEHVRVLTAQDLILVDVNENEDEDARSQRATTSLTGSEIATPPTELTHSINARVKKDLKDVKSKKTFSFLEKMTPLERHRMLLDWGYETEDSDAGSSSAPSVSDMATFSSNGYPLSHGSTSNEEI